MPIGRDNPFKGRQHRGELIILCVRLYLRYPLSYEHVAELAGERGVAVRSQSQLPKNYPAKKPELTWAPARIASRVQ